MADPCMRCRSNWEQLRAISTAPTRVREPRPSPRRHRRVSLWPTAEVANRKARTAHSPVRGLSRALGRDALEARSYTSPDAACSTRRLRCDVWRWMRNCGSRLGGAASWQFVVRRKLPAHCPRVRLRYLPLPPVAYPRSCIEIRRRKTLRLSAKRCVSAPKQQEHSVFDDNH